MENGILGDIRFDEYGDLVEGPVTIFRVVGKGHPGLGGGYEGAVVDRVITARADLLRQGGVPASIQSLKRWTCSSGHGSSHGIEPSARRS